MFATALVLATLSGTAPAVAAWVIEPGHEETIVGLLAPYTPGGEVTPGWTIDGVAIEGEAVRFSLAGPEGAHARVSAVHPEAAPDGRLSPHLSVVVEADTAGGGGAGDALAEAIVANDTGESIWTEIDEAAADGGSEGAGNGDGDGRAVEDTRGRLWVVGVILLAAISMFFSRRLAGGSSATAGKPSGDAEPEPTTESTEGDESDGATVESTDDVESASSPSDDDELDQS